MIRSNYLCPRCYIPLYETAEEWQCVNGTCAWTCKKAEAEPLPVGPDPADVSSIAVHSGINPAP